jgi:hypothetical protein
VVWRGSNAVARIGDGADLLKCSFCGKSQKQVKKLIAGPGIYICDECVGLCNEIIEEALVKRPEVKWDSLPKREGKGGPVKNLSPTEVQTDRTPVHDEPGEMRAVLGDAIVTLVDTDVLIVTIPAGHEVIVRTSPRD